MTTHGEILVYRTGDGTVGLDVRLQDETVWLTQAMMAELFACSVDNVRELDLEATSADFSIVRTEGTHQVTRPDTLSSAPEDRGTRLRPSSPNATRRAPIYVHRYNGYTASRFPGGYRRPCQQELRTDRVTAERSPAGCWSYP